MVLKWGGKDEIIGETGAIEERIIKVARAVVIGIASRVISGVVVGSAIFSKGSSTSCYNLWLYQWCMW